MPVPQLMRLEADVACGAEAKGLASRLAPSAQDAQPSESVAKDPADGDGPMTVGPMRSTAGAMVAWRILMSQVI